MLNFWFLTNQMLKKEVETYLNQMNIKTDKLDT